MCLYKVAQQKMGKQNIGIMKRTLNSIKKEGGGRGINEDLEWKEIVLFNSIINFYYLWKREIEVHELLRREICKKNCIRYTFLHIQI